jgi:hypothetical protein
MITTRSTGVLAYVDAAAAAPMDRRRDERQQTSLTTPADWRLLFDAVIWRMRRQADDPLVGPDLQLETMRDCARALERLQAMRADLLGESIGEVLGVELGDALGDLRGDVLGVTTSGVNGDLGVAKRASVTCLRQCQRGGAVVADDAPGAPPAVAWRSN